MYFIVYKKFQLDTMNVHGEDLHCGYEMDSLFNLSFAKMHPKKEKKRDKEREMK